MQKKLADDAIDLLEYFKQNLTLLNEIIWATATISSLVIVTHEQNCNPNENEGCKKK